MRYVEARVDGEELPGVSIDGSPDEDLHSFILSLVSSVATNFLSLMTPLPAVGRST